MWRASAVAVPQKHQFTHASTPLDGGSRPSTLVGCGSLPQSAGLRSSQQHTMTQAGRSDLCFRHQQSHTGHSSCFVTRCSAPAPNQLGLPESDSGRWTGGSRHYQSQSDVPLTVTDPTSRFESIERCSSGVLNTSLLHFFPSFPSTELLANLPSFLTLAGACVAGSRRGSLRRCGLGERRV